MTNSVKSVKEEECCGCGACYQICPKKSIKLVQNKRGFLIPVVDEKTCIDCGACSEVCPEKKELTMNVIKESYAAIAKDKKKLNVSTSGGVFGVMAEFVISSGGFVYGCAWDENLNVGHKKIERVEEIIEIQRSKYVQSDTKETFLEVQKDLKKGHIVLYSGTACQVAGLRKFLNGKEEKLITIEVACHGVPSPGLFQKYIGWKSEKEKGEIIEMQFRNKEKHRKGEHYMFLLKYKKGKKKYYLSMEDPYYASFLEGKTLRETCYRCKYKKVDRVADILLGDYWGIEKEHKDFPARYGVSAVIIASEKGKRLFDEIKEQLIVENSTFEKITQHNKSIIYCANCDIGNRLKSIEIDADVLFKELKPVFNIKRIIKNIVPEDIKYLLKRI